MQHANQEHEPAARGLSSITLARGRGIGYWLLIGFPDLDIVYYGFAGYGEAEHGQQTDATSAAKRKKQELRLYVRHFFKALNMAIERGKAFRPGDRTYYGLDANQQTLPSLRREADLLRVTQSLVNGEAKRVAAGGQPLTMPSAQEIGRLLEETRALLTQKKRLVASVDRESEDVDRLRGEVADLVRAIWDELEFAQRKDSASTRRRRCREWGVIYRERRGEASHGTHAALTCAASAPLLFVGREEAAEGAVPV